MMIKTTDFAEIISSTQKLKTADLDKLRTKEEKVSFFGNLQNLMFIHMCLYLIEDSTARKVYVNKASHQMSLFFHFPSFIEAFKLNTLKRNNIGLPPFIMFCIINIEINHLLCIIGQQRMQFLRKKRH